MTGDPDSVDNENLFRSIVLESPIPTALLLGQELSIAVANAPQLAAWGKGEGVLGMPFALALPEMEGQPFLAILDDVFTTGKTYASDDSPAQMLVDGVLKTVYFDFTFKPVRNCQGVVYGILATGVDITQQVNTRKKVNESELFARSLIESSPVATAVFVGPDMVTQVVNAEMLELLGQDNSIVGKPFLMAIQALAHTQAMGSLTQVYQSGQALHQNEEKYEFIKQGSPYKGYYNLTYQPLRDTTGQIYGIINTALEVTEQVLARQKLEETQTRLQSIIEQTPAPTLVLRGDDYILDQINEPMRALMGQDRHVIGKSLLASMPELADQFAWQQVRQVYQQGIAYDGQEVLVTHATAGVMQDHYYNIAYRPLREDGQITGVIQVVNEVSEQVLVRQQLQESEARYRSLSDALEQQVQRRTLELAKANQTLETTNQAVENSNGLLLRSNENLQQFAYVASHDLQEPLRKIQQFGNLLAIRQQALSSEELSYIERMQSAASRMATLIRDLLNYSRISTQREESKLVVLHDVVDNVLSTLEFVIAETNAQVEVEPLPTVPGDASQLDMLFQNLLANALKFVQTDSSGVRVPPQIRLDSQTIRVDQLPPWVKPARMAAVYHRIDVIDNGIGFDEKYRDRIFAVFQRLHGKSEFAGTGIGLAICERVVTNHGGAITASSQLGQGATFSVYLPI